MEIGISLLCTHTQVFFWLFFFQLYVELSGAEQPDSVPDTIFLQIRHLSESFFRKGDGSITEFRQPPGNNRTISFRRFSMVDEARCREEEQSGTSKLTLQVPSIHKQIVLTDLHKFSYSISWEDLLKDQSNFPLMITLLIPIIFPVDYVFIL